MEDSNDVNGIDESSASTIHNSLLLHAAQGSFSAGNQSVSLYSSDEGGSALLMMQ